MASQSENASIWCHVLLLGNSGVGKTCIINQQCEGTFSAHGPGTIGCSFQHKRITIDGRILRIMFVDTAGQERYDAIIPMLYRKATLFVLVYDISNKSSFERLTKWLDDIHKYRPDVKNNKVMVIGNKVDLDGREVSHEDGMQFAAENKFIFFETSAKTGQNINEAFEHLLSELIEHAEFSSFQETSLQKVNKPEKLPARRTRRCCSSSLPADQLNTNLSISVSSKDVSTFESSSPIFTLQQVELASVLASGRYVPSTGTGETTQGHSILSTRQMYLVTREISALPNWIDIGLELGLEIQTLRVIKNNEKSLGDCTREMLAAWLEQQDQVEERGGPTWQQLVNALKIRKCKSLAKAIERKYLPRP